MTAEVASTTDPKKRRVMIITADEDIIEQLQGSNESLSIQSIFIDAEDTDGNLSWSKVSNRLALHFF